MEIDLGSLFDALPAMVWTALPDGHIDFVNRRWSDYTGLGVGKAHGWDWQAAVNPDDLPPLLERWRSILESGEPGEMEARVRRFDGQYRWFLVQSSPMRDQAGRIIKWCGVGTDVEDFRQAEEVLRRRELDFRLIVDTIPVPVAVTTPSGEVEGLNQLTRAYFGKTFEELKAWKTSDVVHPDDVERTVAAQLEAHQKGIAYNVESRHRRADGVYRWHNVRGFPLRDPQGRILRWFHLLIDIDERKRAEETLRESELTSRSVIDGIPGFVAILAPDGSNEFVNRQILEYCGRTREDFENWGSDGTVHREDVPHVAEIFTKSIMAGVPYEFDMRLRRFDGVYRWFNARGLPVRYDSGHIVRWYVLLTDIDDRKRAESELKRAYDSFADAQRLSKTGSFVTDLLADDHNWSDEAYRIFEFEPGSKVTVERIRNIIHPDDLQNFDTVIERGTGGKDVHFDFRIVTSRGATKHVRGLAHVVEKVAGRPMFVGALQDVTATKLAEEALNRTRSELAHVARVTALSTLTASIAHEVNQPLSGIITNASTCLRMLAADPPNVDGARETTRRTIRDGNRASEVVGRLHALFSKKSIATETVDLNEVARQVIALSLGELQRKGVSLRTDFADDVPPITGDRVQLQQVVLNLLLNASDAMSGIKDRARLIVIKTDRDEDGNASLTVQDTGIGIDPDAASKLFDAFYTTKAGGMGIGLSVSRSIVERHGGKIWAAPNEGPGATFSFFIPPRPERAGDDGGFGSMPRPTMGSPDAMRNA